MLQDYPDCQEHLERRVLRASLQGRWARSGSISLFLLSLLDVTASFFNALVPMLSPGLWSGTLKPPLGGTNKDVAMLLFGATAAGFAYGYGS